MMTKTENRSMLSALLFIAVFPVVLFYYESVFNLSTSGNFLSLATVSRMLFSFAYGGVGYLLVTLLKKPKAVHIVTAVLMGLCALPYLVEYFVYRQFKVFYDVATVLLGAEDAVGGFSDVIFLLIFSWDGLLKIALFALPAVLYTAFGKKLFPTVSCGWITRCVAVGMMVLCYGISLLVVKTNAVLQPVYASQYNYQSAVQSFGLITGIRLDIKYMNTEDSMGGFELPDIPATTAPVQTQPTDATEDMGTTEPTETQPKEYGYNQLELELPEEKGKLGDLNAYVRSLTPSRQNEYTGLFSGKNLIMITAEAFTAEVIDPQRTPTLYRLATKGIQFTDYYQPNNAGTTGGEYQNIFGMLSTDGGASFKNTASHYNYMTIGSQLDRLGYYGKAFHNNSYTFYSRHKTHNNLGYSDGFMGYGNGMEEYVKKVWPQSDLEMLQGTLPTYIDNQPFNVYYMTVSGHSEYTRTGNTMTKRNWDAVADLECSDMVKGYLAANMELEKAMAYLVGELEAKGIADDTVICIATDHFPYGLDTDGRFGKMTYLSELFGYNVVDYFGRDHNTLILWSGCLEDSDPIVVDSPTSSLDILPTLSNLFGTQYDSRLFPGRDVLSDTEALVFNMNYDWKTDLGTYYSGTGKFVPRDESMTIPEGYVEQMKTVVRNKIRYCTLVLDNDYFRYLFEHKES